MDWKTAERDWPALVPQILTRWPDLDPDTVESIDGDRPAFVDLVAQSEGLDPEAADAEIADFLEGAETADTRMDPLLDNEAMREAGAHVPEGEDVFNDDAAFGDEPGDPQGTRGERS